MNECEQCGYDLASDGQRSCPNCGSSFGEGGGIIAVKTFVKPAIRRRAPVRAECAICVDRTGSSSPYKTRGIEAAGYEILTEIVSKCAESRFWLQSHGDLEYGEHPAILVDGGTDDDVRRALRTIDYRNGGDAEETHTHAIKTLIDAAPFTADPTRARGAVIAFLTDDTKDYGCDLTPEGLGEEIIRRGLVLALIATPAPRIQSLVRAAGGLLIPISNNPDVTELRRAGAMVGKSVTMSFTAGAGTATLPLSMP